MAPGDDVVKFPLSSPNAVDHPAQVLLVRLLPHSVSSTPATPPSRTPVTKAIPAYKAGLSHPSPFKNHRLDFHILLLLKRVRYILPTFIY